MSITVSKKRPIVAYNKITELETRPDFVFDFYEDVIWRNIVKEVIPTRKSGQSVLPVNFAKTKMLFRLSQRFIKNYKTKLFFLTSDQVNTVSKHKVRWEMGEFKKFVVKNSLNLEEEYNVTSLQSIDSICEYITDTPDTIGFITTSTQWFIENHKQIKSILQNYQIDGVWHEDESVRGASSSWETTKDNNGIAQQESKYKATKYKCYEEIKDVLISLGYTGNRIREHYDINFGTENYVTLNPFPQKDETWTMMSAPRKPIYIDVDKPMEYNLSLAINECFRRQQENDIHVRENGMKIGKKHTLLVQLAHGNSSRNNRHELITTLDTMGVEKHWVGMHLGFTASPTKDNPTGVRVFKFMKDGITELTQEEKDSYGYFDDISLRKKYNSEHSPLRTLCIIEKGLKGSNDPSQTTYLSFRPYTTEGVEHQEEQGDGRLKRPFEKLEDITYSVENAKNLSTISKKELWIKTWYIMNTYQPFVPKDSGYERMYENTKDFFCTAEEVIDKLNKMEW